ncbi:LuxR family transcriptional regulator [Streptomyces roseirectus]|uniref:LuxR family transcriptional regulator n=1 Tax=Streptomyces roseirectus TaxID=2768066 RepID=A0A7H0IQZ2_9ACTN|nr:LuxR C-terminal-related transcriptional regulator [Streptomyces roseirectus]QNP75208.1 LuxR family transcriptional regulator [Streptomyces roseirectus]
MSAPVGNLPATLTSFVGRRREVAEIRRLLTVGRLVTLTGTGGVGKTRLALAAGEACAKAFPDGVWLVDLAPVRDPATVAATAASVLRAPDRRSAPDLDRLAEHLARQRALLVLDNCEHVVDESAELAKALLTACPDLRVLVTSRETLAVTGEHVFTVPPMPVADEAVDLLCDRATALRPDFRLTDANRAEAARLCALLDGLPLAIELAASRLRTLSVTQLAHRLADRFALLTGGCRTTHPRQRTLLGMIEWSYELCAPEERTLWNRLSVFTGGFTLDAAEEVCSGDGLPAHHVVDLLDRLVSRSVVLTTQAEGPPRYRLLETIREYGRLRLTETGEHPRTLRRHRDFYLDRAEHLAARWFGPGQQDALAWLRAEHADLVTALECPAADDDGEGALRLAVALRHHWCADGFLTEGHRQLDRLLAQHPRPTPVRVGALWCAAWVALLRGDLNRAQELLDTAEQAGADDPFVTGLRGSLAAFRGDMREAAVHYDEALAAHRRDGDGPQALFWLFQKSVVQVHLGDPAALATSTRAVELAEEHGEHLYRSYALWALGFARWAHGDEEGGLVHTRAALEILRGFNDYAGTVMSLEIFAWITAARGEHERAAVLLGAVRALSRATGVCAAYAFGGLHARCEASIVAALGDAGYEKALAQGLDHDTPARAIALALDDVPAAVTGPAAVDPLTRREREVAALVAEGLTNRQVAGALGLSPRTADTHVAKILAKLGFVCRAQVAAWWTENRTSA